MLTLSRPQRQVLATLAVLVFMVGPTGYVAWNAWWLRQAEHRRLVEKQLGQQLGLDLSIERVRYPQPGTMALRSVSLRVPGPATAEGSASEVAHIDRLVLRSEGRQVTIESEGVVVRADSPRQAMIQVGQQLERLGSQKLDQVNLVAPSCAVEFGPGLPRFRLREIAGTLRLAEDEPVLTASYRLEANGAVTRCESKLTRERRGDAVRSSVTFKTNDGTALPAQVLDMFFNSAEWIGPAARVGGELTLRQTGAGEWEAEFAGSIQDLDLATLLHQVAPRHRLTGRARLDLRAARWADQPGRGPGWIEAHGQLTANAGIIGSQLLEALQSQMRFRPAERLVMARPEHEFQALGLTFDLEKNGEIQFGGCLGPDYLPGAVLVQGQRFVPLVSAPEGTATVPSLIRALALDGQVETAPAIPARFESLMIQRYLPSPPQNAGDLRPIRAN